MKRVSDNGGPDGPLKILVVDHVAVLRANRLRWRRLARQINTEITLLAPKRWHENNVDESFQAPPDQEYRTVLGRVSWPGRELLSFYVTGAIRAIRLSRPDVIILMEESFSLFALQFVLLRPLFARRAKISFYSFNIDSYRKFPYRLDLFYRWLSRVVMRRADLAICPNERARLVLEDSTFRGRIAPLFVGVNEETFLPRERPESRRQLGIDPDVALFLYAGRLLEQKGIEDLIAAFAVVKSERPHMPMRLLIVGSGNWEARLREVAGASDAAKAIEFRSAAPLEEMPTLMAAANVFVLPSRAEWNEQFGRVNAEAMLMGTTIVGSTSGAIPSVIQNGGYLFRAGDVLDLVSVLSSVLDDPEEQERRRETGRQIAAVAYSVQAFVDGIIVELEAIMKRPLRRSTA